MGTSAKKGATWTPPAAAEKLELSEFVAWKGHGDVVIGRIQAGTYTERPDPLNPEKKMCSVSLSPAIFIPGGDTSKGEAYGALALGLSAHLALLLPGVATGQQDGVAFAIVYESDRAPEKKGQRASRQFNVYRLTDAQFRDEARKVTENLDELPF